MSGKIESRLDVGWKPLSLSTTTLVSGVTVTLFLIISLGILLIRSTQDGAITFSSPEGDFSSIQTFLFRFSPIIISVLYSFFWGWIDLDVKRLEPYYQLSKPDGALGIDSLSLEYTSTFFALVPFVSAKKKHWIVFAIATITITVNWLTLPLLSSVFAMKTISRTLSTEVSLPYNLAQLDDSTRQISSDVLRDASSMLWLEQQIPQFTTREFALAPFTPVKLDPRFNGVIKATTDLYQMDMFCNAPKSFSHKQFKSAGWLVTEFDSGDGCIFRKFTDLERLTSVGPDGKLSGDNLQFRHYIFSYNNDWDDLAEVENIKEGWNTNDASCNGESRVFISWSRIGDFWPNYDDPNNATALFCVPSYYSQEVQATIMIPGYNVRQVEKVSQRRPLSIGAFNQSLFERILYKGQTTLLQGDSESSVGFSQDAYLIGMGIEDSEDPLFGFAIGLTHLPAEAFLNATNLVDGFQAACRFVFALAMNKIMVPPDEVKTVRAQSVTTIRAITAVPVFAILTQISLAMIACLAVFIVIRIWKRPCYLHGDPGCLGQTMILARQAEIRSQIFTAYSTGLKHSTLESTSFRLQDAKDGLGPKLSSNISLVNPTAATICDTSELSKPRRVEPTEYKWYVGIFLSILISLSLIIIIAVERTASKNNGISLPISNENLLQFVLSSLPTLVARILEPYWIWLARMACILAPVEIMRCHPQIAKRSLLLRYAAKPPQLAFLRAIVNQNYVLAAISLLAATGGILTVFMSGIFSILPIHLTSTASLPQLYSGEMANFTGLITIDSYGVYFITMANLSGITPLPSWTTTHHFFMPLNLEHLSSSATTVSIRLPGYSLEGRCSEVTQSTGSNYTYQIETWENGKKMSIVASFISDQGRQFKCVPSFQNQFKMINDPFDDENTIFNRVARGPSSCNATKWRPPKIMRIDGMAQSSVLLGAKANKTLFEDERTGLDAANLGYLQEVYRETCHEVVFFGGIHSGTVTNTIHQLKTNHTSSDEDRSDALIACRPEITTTVFDLVVNRKGQIVSADPIGKPSSKNVTDIDFVLPLASTTAFLNNGQASNDICDQRDTDQQQPLEYILDELKNSTSLFDPNKPLPSTDSLKAGFNDAYARLFVANMRAMLPRYLPADSTANPIAAKVVIVELRIFVSQVAFKATVIILSIQFIGALAFFSTRPRPFLGRLPINLAAQISLFANSNVIDDVIEGARGDFDELDRQGWRFAYGKVLDNNGRYSEGVHHVPFVERLDKQLTGFEHSLIWWEKKWERFRNHTAKI